MNSMVAIVRTQASVFDNKKSAFGRIHPTTMRRTVKGKAGSGPNFKLDQPEKLWEIGSSSCAPLFSSQCFQSYPSLASCALI